MNGVFRRAQKRAGLLLRVTAVIAVVAAPLAVSSSASAALSSPTWTVMDPRTNIAGNRYDYGFTTGATNTVSRVTATVPAGTTGSNRYLSLPGSTGNNASTPNGSANQITGDIDVRVKVAMDNWAVSSDTRFINKWDYGMATPDGSWAFGIANGKLIFRRTFDGSIASTQTAYTSNAVLPFASGSSNWVRVTYSPNSSSNGTIIFYTSANGTNWTQSGSTLSTASGLLNSSNAPLRVGADAPAGDHGYFPGKIFFSSLAAGINGTTTSQTSCASLGVANCFDPNNDTVGGTSWTSASPTSETWTINRSGSDRPADIASDLSVMNVSGLPSGGAAQLREIDGVASYTLPTATSIATGTAVKLGLAGMVNTYSAGSYSSIIKTLDGSSGQLETSSATGAVSFLDSTISTTAGRASLLSTTSGKLATNANIFPYGMDLANGKLYVSNQITNTVDTVDLSTNLATRYIGSGGLDSSGSGLANRAVNQPRGVTADTSGNIYYIDQYSQTLQKVDKSTGNVTKVAGGGYGYSGDGAAATSAAFLDLENVAFDSTGNIYITDPGNNRIRKITTADGKIQTIAGTGTGGYSGDGGAATSAKLSYPMDVVLDSSNNVYFADTNNHVIRRIDASTGYISTVAGNGTSGFSGDGAAATSAKLSGPRSVAVATNGDLYISDTGNNKIRKVTAATGFISTYAGGAGGTFAGDGAAATSASLWNPLKIRLDGTGNVYFSDNKNFRIRKIDPSGTITTIWGNGRGFANPVDGRATSSDLYGNRGMATDGNGNLFIADDVLGNVRKIDQWGNVATYAGQSIFNRGASGDGGAATSATINAPNSVAIANTGTLYIADNSSANIRSVTSSGTISSFVSGYQVTAIALNPITQDLWFTSGDNCTIRKATPSGTVSAIAGTPGTCTSTGDGGLASAATVNVPTAIVFDVSGNAFFIENGSKIRRIDAASGSITTFAGGGPNAGTQNNIYAKSLQLQNASGLASDSLKNLYVADGTRIHRITPGGIVTAVAGSGYAGFSGDGGSATSANLGGVSTNNSNAFRLSGLTFANGSLYIGDRSQTAIRKVENISPAAPLVNADTMSVPMNTSRSWPILSNDWSRSNEMDPSSVTITTQPTNGTVSITNPTTEASTLQAVYTPTAGYSGSDSFTYQACDTTRVQCATATTSVTVGSNQVTTVAGGVAEGYANTIGFTPARASRFRNYIFYSDNTLNVIRRFDTYSQQSVVVAGNEIPSTINGVGNASSVKQPYGLSVGPDGTVYFVDNGSSSLRTLSTSGALTTIGSGLGGGGGGLTLGQDGAIYITVTAGVMRWTGSAFAYFAGNGTIGNSGNGGSATGALLNSPQSLTTALNGDIYISDMADCTVRKVSAGQISLVAGTPGSCGNSGDGAAATAATLNQPRGMTFDTNGNLLVSDFANNSIRKVASSGTISTLSISGIGMSSPLDIVAGSSGDFFVFNYGSLIASYVNTSSAASIAIGNYTNSNSPDSQDPLATELSTGSQDAPIVMDGAGVLMIGQGGSGYVSSPRIRRISSGGVVSTPVFNVNTTGATKDNSGNFVFSDYGNCKVFRLNSDMTTTNIAGNGTCATNGNGGPANVASLNRPFGLAYDATGNLFIAEGSGNVIRKVDTSGNISTIGGTGTAGFSGDGGSAASAQFSSPRSLAIDKNGNLLVADFGNSRIRVIDKGLTVATIAGSTPGFSGDGGSATSAQMNSIRSIVVDSANNIFVSDSNNYRIRKIESATGTISTVAGAASGQFSDNASASSANFGQPGGLALDSAGNLYLSDVNNHRIRKVSGVASAATNTVSSAAWTVVPAATGHTNLRERLSLTPSVTTTSSKITAVMPTSFAGSSPTVVESFGLSGTASAAVSGTTLTLSFPSQSLTAGVPIGVAVEGITNGGSNGAWTSYVTTYDSAGSTAIGWANSNVVNITSSGAPVQGGAGFGSLWKRSLSTTPSAFATVAVSPSGATDTTSSFTITGAGSINNNSVLFAAGTMTTGTKNFTPITTDATSSVASASFATDRWGVQLTSSGSLNSGLGSGYYSGLPSSSTPLVTAVGATGTATTTARAKVDYLQPAGTYKSTLTWRIAGGV